MKKKTLQKEEDLMTPNKKTIKAIKECKEGHGIIRCTSFEDLVKNLKMTSKD